jgi:MSHA biogenesis protein MshQ
MLKRISIVFFALFALAILPSIAFADKVTYDYANRTPGANIWAYAGAISSTPTANTTPSAEFNASSDYYTYHYPGIKDADNSYSYSYTSSSNTYASQRFVIEIDERESLLSKIDINWNGYAYQTKNNSIDTYGATLYIWNYSNSVYDEIDTTNSTTSLEKSITSSLSDYIGGNSNNTITLLAVANDKANGNNKESYIGTDYISVDITASSEPDLIADYRFDECEYTGIGPEVIDQTGSHPATTRGGAVNTFDYGQIQRAVELTDKDQYIETSIPLSANFSVSTWFKKPNSNTNNPYFVLGAMQNGGDLLYLDRNNNWRWGVYNASTGSVDGSFLFGTLDNSWHHMVLVYSGGSTQLYIDGTYRDSVNQAPTGTLKYIGTSFDGVTGNDAQGFRAPLDEFKIYDASLSNNEIASIYKNELARNNYDGSPRDKVQCNNICSNTLNAVGIKIGGEWWHDSSLGNTSEALAIYAAWLDAGSPASGSIDNNTYYVTASGSSSVDRIDFGRSEHDFTGTLPYPGVSGEDFLVHTSGKLSLPAGDYTIYVESDDGFSFVMNTLFGDTVSFNKFGNSTSGNSNELRYERPTSNSNTGGSFTLSQDSVFDIAAIFFERGGQDFLEISIANDIRTNAAPNGYQILRDGALNGKVKFGECSTPSQIDHYEISHDGNGVTCAASLITVTAHDASHSPVNVSKDTRLTITTSPSVDSIISSPVIISAGTSSASFYLNQGSPLSNIDIDVTDGAASDPDDAGTEDPLINFLDSAFRFYVNGSHTDSTAIGTQIAGKPSATAPGNQTLTLRAVRTNTDTGACEAALEGTTAVELAYECNDPTTCTASDLLSLTGVNTATISRNDNAVTPKSYSSVNMKFDANGIAPFSFDFSDAGKITLFARKTVAAKSPQPSFTLLGQSNKFVTRPFAFHIDIPDNPSATNADEGKFKKAGESFTATLTAKLWQASDDNNNDGKPDSNNVLSDNSVTLNFGNEITPATANLAHTLFLPNSGNNPSLLNSSFSNFNSGSRSRSDLSWAEVGIIELNAKLSNNNYLGASDVTGNVPYVGRFIPDHFTLSSSSVSYASSGLMEMSYMDQPNLLLSYTLEARNADNVITKNYQGVFAKATAGIQAENNNDGTNLSTRLSGGGSNWIGGIYSQANATWTFHRAVVKDGPYDNLLLAISISDTIDNVPLEGLNINVNTADPSCAPNCTAKVLNSTKSIVRFGRWILENSYGPETIALRVPMQTQYWDGKVFVSNDTDSFTTFNSASAAISNNALIPSPVANPSISGNGTFNNGETNQLILSSPGAGKHGSVDVTSDVPNWLKFDWNNGGLYNENPSAQVNFGLYRGNDRIIYRQEVFE